MPKAPAPRSSEELAANLLSRTPTLPDDDQDPPTRALALALEKAERALEPLRAGLPEDVYELLVLELVGEVLVQPTLAAAFEELVPGATLQSGVRVRPGAEAEPAEKSGGARG